MKKMDFKSRVKTFCAALVACTAGAGGDVLVGGVLVVGGVTMAIWNADGSIKQGQAVTDTHCQQLDDALSAMTESTRSPQATKAFNDSCTKGSDGRARVK